MSAAGLTDEQITEYRDAFDLFDQDGSGAISIDELKEVMKKLGNDTSQSDLQSMVNEIDKNGDGEIDFNEFIILMSNKFEDSNLEDEIRQAFRSFDQDGDGFIDAEELKNVMRNLGDNISDEHVKEMISEADIDGDGKVNLEEFIRMMKG